MSFWRTKLRIEGEFNLITGVYGPETKLYFSARIKKHMLPTYRPNKAKRAKHIGFRARMATAGGRRVLSARRAKGRHELIKA